VQFVLGFFLPRSCFTAMLCYTYSGNFKDVMTIMIIIILKFKTLDCQYPKGWSQS